MNFDKNAFLLNDEYIFSSEEIKKIEAGLYYIKLIEIEKEIDSTKNILLIQ